MSFTNITPDVNPDGSRFVNGTTPFGVRYFYFTFTPSSKTVNFFLVRNIYRNEESITRIFTTNAPVSVLSNENVTNVKLPCTFINGRIGLYTPSGTTYKNETIMPDLNLNNLVIGNLYILESRTIYNDPGMDFGVKINDNSGAILPLTYVQASIFPVTPTIPNPIPLPGPPLPIPLPIPIPNPTGFPMTPNGLVASSNISGVSLTWLPTAKAVSYLIYKEGLLLSTSTTTDYSDYQVISGNPYSYSVSGINSLGEGQKSAVLNFTPNFSFSNLAPNRSPFGAIIANSNIRFYYFLFTPLSSAVDVFLCNGQSSTSKSIIGIYDTTDTSSTNELKSSNISMLDKNVSLASKTFGGFTFSGISVTASGLYENVGMTPNFRITMPFSDLSTSSLLLKTYILEVVAYKNTSNPFGSDFSICLKNVGFPNGMTQITYNSVNFTRTIPMPYIISFDFTGISVANYTQYVYPNLFVFQNIKAVLECIISSSPNVRGFNQNNDMLVHFTISDLANDVLGESSLNKWTVDVLRSPDLTIEQSITFNILYFMNGYMTSPANFNGSGTVNNNPNITLFNVLLHEMIHGLGFFYNNSYNATSLNVGWNPFLTDVVDNTPFYKGPLGSAALSSYKTYCKNAMLERIPVEANYGAGTALNHWAEGDAPNIPMENRYFNGTYTPALKYELMTGFINKNDFMTGLTSGALKDYGYNVNLICPYVVAHPYVNMMPIVPGAIGDFTVKCMSIADSSKVIHRLTIDTPSITGKLPNFEQNLMRIRISSNDVDSPNAEDSPKSGDSPKAVKSAMVPSRNNFSIGIQPAGFFKIVYPVFYYR